MKKEPLNKFLSIFFFVLLFAVYVLAEFGSSSSAASKDVFTIGGHPIPVAALAGVFSSLSVMILISWVLFYRKIGFYTSLVIIVSRIIRLTFGLLHFHGASLPAIFMSLVALVCVLIVYSRNESIQKFQEKHRKEVEEFTTEVIGAFANCIDGKDSYTKGHSQRVALYTKILAQHLGENKENIDRFYNIALLHDIGKIGIPDSILTKEGRLTDEEFAIIKSHAQRGYEILRDIKMQKDLADGAHYHHERFDGTGYPSGLAGNKIPWVARIISVADTFDAMSSNRSYRKRLPLDFIAKEIESCSGTQFDPVVANAFLELYNEGAFNFVNIGYQEPESAPKS